MALNAQESTLWLNQRLGFGVINAIKSASVPNQTFIGVASSATKISVSIVFPKVFILTTIYSFYKTAKTGLGYS